MIKGVTDTDFSAEVLQAKGIVLVDVFAQWCGPCKAMAPVLDEVAEELQGKVKVLKLDVDKSPETPGKYGVLSVPTLLFFKDGQLVDQQIGLIAKQSLKDKIASL